MQPVGPTHIELEVRFEAPDLKRSEAIRRHLALGNPLLDTEGDELIAVHQIERIYYDHREAEDGELVWQCDWCGAYSVTRHVVETHEATCPDRVV